VLPHWPPVRCKPCSPAKGRSLERSSAPPRAVFQYKPCSHVRAPLPRSLVLCFTKLCSLMAAVRCKPCSPAKGRSFVRSSAPPRAVFPHRPCSHVCAPHATVTGALFYEAVLPNGRPFSVNRAPRPKAAPLYGPVLTQGPLLYKAVLPQWLPARCKPCVPAKGRFLVRSSAPPWAYFNINRPPLYVLPCHRHWRSLVQSSAPPIAASSE